MEEVSLKIHPGWLASKHQTLDLMVGLCIPQALVWLDYGVRLTLSIHYCSSHITGITALKYHDRPPYVAALGVRAAISKFRILAIIAPDDPKAGVVYAQ